MQPTIARLRSDASKCRDLASTAITPDAREILTSIAERYEHEALAMDRAPKPRRPAFVWPQL